MRKNDEAKQIHIGRDFKGNLIQGDHNDFTFEYEYIPSPDAEERLAQFWDIIFALILEDIQNEQRGEKETLESEPCSNTPTSLGIGK